MYIKFLQGKVTTTPNYSGSRKYTTRSNKNYWLNRDSVGYVRGLHESWEWFDKCAKRSRNQGEFYI
jgi:hypothetical protein